MAPALASSMAARGRGSVDDYEMSDAGSGSEQQRVKIEIDEDGDPKRKAKKGKKTKAKTVRDTKTAGTSTSSATRHGPSKKPSAWTGEEDWAMFKLVHPKAKVDWAAVALAVGNGRDAKVRVGVRGGGAMRRAGARLSQVLPASRVRGKTGKVLLLLPPPLLPPCVESAKFAWLTQYN